MDWINAAFSGVFFGIYLRRAIVFDDFVLSNAVVYGTMLGYKLEFLALYGRVAAVDNLAEQFNAMMQLK